MKSKIVLAIVAVLVLVLVTGFPAQVDIRDGVPRVTIGNQVSAQEADYTCDGVNDHLELQEALDDLPSTGGMIYILAGSYSFGNGETVTRGIDNVSLVGIGGATNLTGDGVTPLFQAGGDRWLFANMRVGCDGIAMAGTSEWCWLNVYNCTELYSVLTDTSGEGGMEQHGNEWHTPDFATLSAVTVLTARLNAINATVIDLDGRLDDAELDILVLQVDVVDLGNWLSGNVSVLQGQITSNDGDITVLQGNVTDLAGNMTVVQGDITVLQGNVTDLASWLSGNVSYLQGQITSNDGDIAVLQGNVTDLAGNMTNLKTVGIVYVIDGGGEAISTGVAGFLEIPFDCTITAWSIVADQSGSIVVDVWNDNYANFPPTVADTIAGSEKPTLSTAQKNQDTNLTTWTTGVDAGDFLAFNVDSASTVERVTVTLTAVRVTE